MQAWYILRGCNIVIGIRKGLLVVLCYNIYYLDNSLALVLSIIDFFIWTAVLC